MIFMKIIRLIQNQKILVIIIVITILAGIVYLANKYLNLGNIIDEEHYNYSCLYKCKFKK